MSIEVQFCDSPSQLILDTNTLYLMFGYGTGDTFNAMIHLRKAPPAREYALIIKRPQFNLVLFLLGMFKHPPVRIHVVDHWKHDFSAIIANLFPTIPFIRSVEPSINRVGFTDFWLNPFNYNKIIPLTDGDIDEMKAYFASQPPKQPLPDRSVILFPTAGANFSDYIPPWARMVETLKNAGISHVYVNQSGVADYGDETIEGAEPINLPHEELIRTMHTDQRIGLVAVRSGVLDILRFCGQRALVLYQPQPSGIFDTCRFGLLRHNLDMIETICLNHSTEHQNQVVDFYLQHFIASSIER